MNKTFFGSVHSSGQISEPLGGLESLKGASKQQEDTFSVFAQMHLFKLPTEEEKNYQREVTNGDNSDYQSHKRRGG